MTVETTDSRKQYETNGTTGPWTVNFYFLADTDLEVIYTDADGDETTLALNVGYTVTGAGDPSGGTVTTTTAYASGGTITISNEVEALQETDYADTDSFPAATHERALDRLTQLSQRSLRLAGRGLRKPASDETDMELPGAAARALRVMGFDADGAPVMLTHTEDGGASLALDLLDTSNASKNAGMVAVSMALAYGSASMGKAMRDRVWCITDRPFNAVGDGVTDNYAAILAAQTALAAAGGGTLIIPRGVFRTLTAIPRVPTVDYAGLGWASILEPVGCSAFTYGYVTGFGQSATRNMWIRGASGSSQIGIYQAGTLDDADELYGVIIEGCAITGFNVAVQFRTVRNLTITGNWFQDVNSAVNLIGKCLVYFIHHNHFVKASGSGAGTSRGVYLAAFDFTDGAGVIGPEGGRINTNLTQGFEYGIDVAFAIELRIENPDITASRIGIRFSSAISLSIVGGYVQVAGALAEFGIHAAAQGAVNETKYLIKGVNINAAGGAIPANASGIMVGTRSVTGNVDYLTVEDCEFSGWTGYDIEQFASGNNRYIGNHCNSTAATASMRFLDTIAARKTFVDQNTCILAISYATTETGLVLGTNSEAGVPGRGGSQTLTGAGAVSLANLRTVLVTTGANALTLADGYEGQEKFIVMKTDGGDGTLTPTNLHNGTTITFNDVGDSASLLFMDGQWVFMGGTATLA